MLYKNSKNFSIGKNIFVQPTNQGFLTSTHTKSKVQYNHRPENKKMAGTQK